MNLSKLLTFHAIITFAASVVLIVAPGMIPGVLGVRLDKSAYIICYLLAGSELGIAVLSFYSRALTDAKALRVIALTCIIFHSSTGLLELYAWFGGLSAAIWGNILLRVIVVILFWYYGFHKTAGKSTVA